MCVLRERTLMLSGCLVSLQPQHTNVCFWYLPPGVRNLEDKVEKTKRLHKVRKLRFNQWMLTELISMVHCRKKRILRLMLVLGVLKDAKVI